MKLSVQTGDRFRGGCIEPPTSEQDDIVIHFTDADRARIAFERAAELDPLSPAPQINLDAIRILQESAR